LFAIKKLESKWPLLRFSRDIRPHGKERSKRRSKRCCQWKYRKS